MQPGGHGRHAGCTSAHSAGDRYCRAKGPRGLARAPATGADQAEGSGGGAGARAQTSKGPTPIHSDEL
jgi:hypothetical protein